MSKIALTPNASGTGTFSIASPGTNTDRTLTLPDATGTVVLADATQTLTNKSIAASQLTGDVAAARITGALNATGSAPMYACRAWVNFNAVGTIAIRASGNVSSITDYGLGDFGVNFTAAMLDANYAVVASFKTTTTLPTPTGEFDQAINAYASSASECAIYTGWRNEASSGRIDPVQVHVAVFR
jgi:hypothetical protein